MRKTVVVVAKTKYGNDTDFNDGSVEMIKQGEKAVTEWLYS